MIKQEFKRYLQSEKSNHHNKTRRHGNLALRIKVVTRDEKTSFIIKICKKLL
jgi:hypothetical protein